MKEYKTFYISIDDHSKLTSFYKTGLIGGINQIDSKHSRFEPFYLSEVPFIDQDQFSIRVKITIDEIERHSEQKNDLIRLFKRPLPISRIECIIAKDVDKLKNKIATDSISTAFLSDVIEGKPTNADGIKYLREYAFDDSVTKELEIYNRYLGGYALLQALALEDKTKQPILDLIDNLSQINDLIDSSKFCKIGGDGYKKFYEEKWDSIFFNYLFEKVSINKQNLKKDASVQVGKYSDNLTFNNPTNFKEIFTHILYNYASYEGRTVKTIDSYLEELFEGVFSKQSKFDERSRMTFYIGFVYGYQNLSTQYRIGGRNIICKFNMETDFDISLVEALYQFVFNGSIKILGKDYKDILCISNIGGSKAHLDGTIQVLDKTFEVENQNSSIGFWDKFIRLIKKWFNR